MRVKYLLICIAALYISPETEIFICALRNSSKTFLQFILGGKKATSLVQNLILKILKKQWLIIP